MNQIAILVDSGCNIPQEVAAQGGIYTVPLKMNYAEGEYRDGVDITPEEVYTRLEKEIPTTSLPSGEEIEAEFAKIKADGYTQVICVHISSNLSGTMNMVRLVAEEQEGLEVRLVDTKNIAMGSGFLGMYARELVEQGLELDDIVAKVEEKVAGSHVFFCVDTLKYLQKGGRIGLVGSILGSTLNLKPIISCNEEGVYYTVAKVRGKRHAIERILDLVAEEAEKSAAYDICVCHGGAYGEFDGFVEMAKEKFAPAHSYQTEISPTLGVHTGPGLLGIGIFPRG